MELKIGLYKSQPGWEIILQQEGLNFEIITPDTKISFQRYSVIVINEILNADQDAKVREFIKNGGAAIYLYSAYTNKKKKLIRTKKIKYLVTDSDSIYSNLGLIDFYTTFIRLKDDSFNIIDRNLFIQYKKVEKGYILIIPFDVDQLILNTQSIRKKFWTDRKELPSEIVAKVSKGKIRKIVSKSIEFLHQKRGLPLVQLWQFPKIWDTIFIFRIDTDFCNPEEASKLYKVCKKNKISGTWFVDTVSKDTIINVYKNMDDQEIAFHCRRHLVFNDYKKDHENIENGLNDLKEAGINVSGFAAPYGEWNKNLAEVLEYFKFDYSSEFTLDYDNLPFYPLINNKKSNVLQIPMHPVSTGRLRRSHFADREKWQYFKNYIDRQIASFEPIFIYHHPSHGDIELFDKIFEYIAAMNINRMTYHQFSEWWKKRLGFQYEITYMNGEINCNYKGEVPDLSLKISYNNKFVITNLKKTIRIDELDLLELKNDKIKSDIKRIRKRNWRDFLYNYESRIGRKNK
ncbi:hypothetical protein D4R71_07725 [bacterium]|nr:MAG: hypothetical protein D4R71_07725 [bacterium]